MSSHRFLPVRSETAFFAVQSWCSVIPCNVPFQRVDVFGFIFAILTSAKDCNDVNPVVYKTEILTYANPLPTILNAYE